MININHLHPENWVGIKHSFGIEEARFSEIEEKAWPKICGLPITEDRLVKHLGFSYRSDVSGSQKVDDLIRLVELTKNEFYTVLASTEEGGWKIRILDSEFREILVSSIRYIHQLQNITLDITGYVLFWV